MFTCEGGPALVIEAACQFHLHIQTDCSGLSAPNSEPKPKSEPEPEQLCDSQKDDEQRLTCTTVSAWSSGGG